MQLLIVIDSVNFHGGAHIATWAMIDALKARGVEVEILTGCEPNEEMKDRLKGVPIYVMKDPFPRKGVRFLVQGVCRRMKLGWVPNWTIDPSGKWRKKAAQYDTVLVIGENSHYRSLIGSVKDPKKVVFIHTDYVSWRTATSYNRVDARCDKWTYRKFDKIAVVGKPNAERFAAAFPELKDKVCAFHNLMPRVERMTRQANEIFTIATFGRLEFGAPKATDRIIRIAARLKDCGYNFLWINYGDVGNDKARFEQYVREFGVQDVFLMPGPTNNVAEKMAEADIVAHLSMFEGMSNAIFEALLCGTPVIATDVGGAREQIESGKTGLIVSSCANEIVAKISDLISHPEVIESWRKNLEAYHYDNEKVVDEYMEIILE